MTPEASPAAPGARARCSRRRAISADVLERVEGDVLTVVDEAERRIYNVRFGDIRLARLDFEWPERGR